MATADKFGSVSSHGILANGSDLLPVTPSDDDDLPQMARAIRCRPDGSDGALSFVTVSGETRSTYISAGEVLPVMATKILATGTAATNLEVLV